VHRRPRRHQRRPSQDLPSSSRRASQDRHANRDHRANRDRHPNYDRRPNRRRSVRRSGLRSLGRAHRKAVPPRRNSWRSLHLQPASSRPQRRYVFLHLMFPRCSAPETECPERSGFIEAALRCAQSSATLWRNFTSLMTARCVACGPDSAAGCADPRSLTKTNGDDSLSRWSRRRGRSSSPRRGWVLGLPFLTRRTCRTAAPNSTPAQVAQLGRPQPVSEGDQAHGVT
jgi:hypothetical protein